VFGTTAKIRVPALVSCASCAGTGAKPGTKPTTCPTCRGVGQVRMQQGFFSIQQTCPRCQGRGTIIPEPCETCRGSGRVEEQKTLSVKVPAGVDNGDRIRLAGEGEHGEQGGPPGDLYVQIRVKPHPIFTREDSDLYCEVPISFTTAALGGDLEVPTLDGRVNLKIPAETQTGKVFRVRGKGVKPGAWQGRQAGAWRPHWRFVVPGQHRNAGQFDQGAKGIIAAIRRFDGSRRQTPQPARRQLAGWGQEIF